MLNYLALIGELKDKGIYLGEALEPLADGRVLLPIHFDPQSRVSEWFVIRLITHHRIAIQNIETTNHGDGSSDTLVTTFPL